MAGRRGQWANQFFPAAFYDRFWVAAPLCADDRQAQTVLFTDPLRLNVGGGFPNSCQQSISQVCLVRGLCGDTPSMCGDLRRP